MSAVERMSGIDPALTIPLGGDLALRRIASTTIELSTHRGRSDLLSQRLGLPSPGRFREVNGMTLLAYRPGCWIVTKPGDDEAGILRAFLAQDDRADAAVIDQSHGKHVLQLSGQNARVLLLRGCRLDLRDSAFSAGSTGTTLIGQITVTLACDRPGTDYRLLVGASFASSLVDWFARTARHMAI